MLNRAFLMLMVIVAIIGIIPMMIIHIPVFIITGHKTFNWWMEDIWEYYIG